MADGILKKYEIQITANTDELEKSLKQAEQAVSGLSKNSGLDKSLVGQFDSVRDSISKVTTDLNGLKSIVSSNAGVLSSLTAKTKKDYESMAKSLTDSTNEINNKLQTMSDNMQNLFQGNITDGLKTQLTGLSDSIDNVLGQYKNFTKVLSDYSKGIIDSDAIAGLADSLNGKHNDVAKAQDSILDQMQAQRESLEDTAKVIEGTFKSLFSSKGYKGLADLFNDTKFSVGDFDIKELKSFSAKLRNFVSDINKSKIALAATTGGISGFFEGDFLGGVDDKAIDAFRKSLNAKINGSTKNGNSKDSGKIEIGVQLADSGDITKLKSELKTHVIGELQKEADANKVQIKYEMVGADGKKVTASDVLDSLKLKLTADTSAIMDAVKLAVDSVNADLQGESAPKLKLGVELNKNSVNEELNKGASLDLGNVKADLTDTIGKLNINTDGLATEATLSAILTTLNTIGQKAFGEHWSKVSGNRGDKNFAVPNAEDERHYIDYRRLLGFNPPTSELTAAAKNRLETVRKARVNAAYGYTQEEDVKNIWKSIVKSETLDDALKTLKETQYYKRFVSKNEYDDQGNLISNKNYSVFGDRNQTIDAWHNELENYLATIYSKYHSDIDTLNQFKEQLFNGNTITLGMDKTKAKYESKNWRTVFDKGFGRVLTLDDKDVNTVSWQDVVIGQLRNEQRSNSKGIGRKKFLAPRQDLITQMMASNPKMSKSAAEEAVISEYYGDKISNVKASKYFTKEYQELFNKAFENMAKGIERAAYRMDFADKDDEGKDTINRAIRQEWGIDGWKYRSYFSQQDNGKRRKVSSYQTMYPGEVPAKKDSDPSFNQNWGGALLQKDRKKNGGKPDVYVARKHTALNEYEGERDVLYALAPLQEQAQEAYANEQRNTEQLEAQVKIRQRLNELIQEGKTNTAEYQALMSSIVISEEELKTKLDPEKIQKSIDRLETKKRTNPTDWSSDDDLMLARHKQDYETAKKYKMYDTSTVSNRLSSLTGLSIGEVNDFASTYYAKMSKTSNAEQGARFKELANKFAKNKGIKHLNELGANDHSILTSGLIQLGSEGEFEKLNSSIASLDAELEEIEGKLNFTGLTEKDKTNLNAQWGLKAEERDSLLKQKQDVVKNFTFAHNNKDFLAYALNTTYLEGAISQSNRRKGAIVSNYRNAALAEIMGDGTSDHPGWYMPYTDDESYRKDLIHREELKAENLYYSGMGTVQHGYERLRNGGYSSRYGVYTDYSGLTKEESGRWRHNLREISSINKRIAQYEAYKKLSNPNFDPTDVLFEDEEARKKYYNKKDVKHNFPEVKSTQLDLLRQDPQIIKLQEMIDNAEQFETNYSRYNELVSKRANSTDADFLKNTDKEFKSLDKKFKGMTQNDYQKDLDRRIKIAKDYRDSIMDDIEKKVDVAANQMVIDDANYYLGAYRKGMRNINANLKESQMYGTGRYGIEGKDSKLYKRDLRTVNNTRSIYNQISDNGENQTALERAIIQRNAAQTDIDNIVNTVKENNNITPEIINAFGDVDKFRNKTKNAQKNLEAIELELNDLLNDKRTFKNYDQFVEEARKLHLVTGDENDENDFSWGIRDSAFEDYTSQYNVAKLISQYRPGVSTKSAFTMLDKIKTYRKDRNVNLDKLSSAQRILNNATETRDKNGDKTPLISVDLVDQLLDAYERKEDAEYTISQANRDVNWSAIDKLRKQQTVVHNIPQVIDNFNNVLAALPDYMQNSLRSNINKLTEARLTKSKNSKYTDSQAYKNADRDADTAYKAIRRTREKLKGKDLERFDRAYSKLVTTQTNSGFYFSIDDNSEALKTQNQLQQEKSQLQEAINGVEDVAQQRLQDLDTAIVNIGKKIASTPKNSVEYNRLNKKMGTLQRTREAAEVKYNSEIDGLSTLYQTALKSGDVGDLNKLQERVNNLPSELLQSTAGNNLLSLTQSIMNNQAKLSRFDDQPDALYAYSKSLKEKEQAIFDNSKEISLKNARKQSKVGMLKSGLNVFHSLLFDNLEENPYVKSLGEGRVEQKNVSSREEKLAFVKKAEDNTRKPVKDSKVEMHRIKNEADKAAATSEAKSQYYQNRIDQINKRQLEIKEERNKIANDQNELNKRKFKYESTGKFYVAAKQDYDDRFSNTSWLGGADLKSTDLEDFIDSIIDSIIDPDHGHGEITDDEEKILLNAISRYRKDIVAGKYQDTGYFEKFANVFNNNNNLKKLLRDDYKEGQFIYDAMSLEDFFKIKESRYGNLLELRKSAYESEAGISEYKFKNLADWDEQSLITEANELTDELYRVIIEKARADVDALIDKKLPKENTLSNNQFYDKLLKDSERIVNAMPSNYDYNYGVKDKKGNLIATNNYQQDILNHAKKRIEDRRSKGQNLSNYEQWRRSFYATTYNNGFVAYASANPRPSWTMDEILKAYRVDSAQEILQSLYEEQYSKNRDVDLARTSASKKREAINKANNDYQLNKAKYDLLSSFDMRSPMKTLGDANISNKITKLNETLRNPSERLNDESFLKANHSFVSNLYDELKKGNKFGLGDADAEEMMSYLGKTYSGLTLAEILTNEDARNKVISIQKEQIKKGYSNLYDLKIQQDPELETRMKLLTGGSYKDRVDKLQEQAISAMIARFNPDEMFGEFIAKYSEKFGNTQDYLINNTVGGQRWVFDSLANGDKGKALSGYKSEMTNARNVLKGHGVSDADNADDVKNAIFQVNKTELADVFKILEGKTGTDVDVLAEKILSANKKRKELEAEINEAVLDYRGDNTNVGAKKILDKYGIKNVNNQGEIDKVIKSSLENTNVTELSNVVKRLFSTELQGKSDQEINDFIQMVSIISSSSILESWKKKTKNSIDNVEKWLNSEEVTGKKGVRSAGGTGWLWIGSETDKGGKYISSITGRYTDVDHENERNDKVDHEKLFSRLYPRGTGRTTVAEARAKMAEDKEIAEFIYNEIQAAHERSVKKSNAPTDQSNLTHGVFTDEEYDAKTAYNKALGELRHAQTNGAVSTVVDQLRDALNKAQAEVQKYDTLTYGKSGFVRLTDEVYDKRRNLPVNDFINQTIKNDDYKPKQSAPTYSETPWVEGLATEDTLRQIYNAITEGNRILGSGEDRFITHEGDELRSQRGYGNTAITNGSETSSSRWGNKGRDRIPSNAVYIDNPYDKKIPYLNIKGNKKKGIAPATEQDALAVVNSLTDDDLSRLVNYGDNGKQQGALAMYLSFLLNSKNTNVPGMLTAQQIDEIAKKAGLKQYTDKKSGQKRYGVSEKRADSKKRQTNPIPPNNNGNNGGNNNLPNPNPNPNPNNGGNGGGNNPPNPNPNPNDKKKKKKPTPPIKNDHEYDDSTYHINDLVQKNMDAFLKEERDKYGKEWELASDVRTQDAYSRLNGRSLTYKHYDKDKQDYEYRTFKFGLKTEEKNGKERIFAAELPGNNKLPTTSKQTQAEMYKNLHLLAQELDNAQNQAASTLSQSDIDEWKRKRQEYYDYKQSIEDAGLTKPSLGKSSDKIVGELEDEEAIATHYRGLIENAYGKNSASMRVAKGIAYDSDQADMTKFVSKLTGAMTYLDGIVQLGIVSKEFADKLKTDANNAYTDVQRAASDKTTAEEKRAYRETGSNYGYKNGYMMVRDANGNLVAGEKWKNLSQEEQTNIIDRDWTNALAENKNRFDKVRNDIPKKMENFMRYQIRVADAANEGYNNPQAVLSQKELVDYNETKQLQEYLQTLQEIENIIAQINELRTEAANNGIFTDEQEVGDLLNRIKEIYTANDGAFTKTNNRHNGVTASSDVYGRTTYAIDFSLQNIIGQANSNTAQNLGKLVEKSFDKIGDISQYTQYAREKIQSLQNKYKELNEMDISMFDDGQMKDRVKQLRMLETELNNVAVNGNKVVSSSTLSKMSSNFESWLSGNSRVIAKYRSEVDEFRNSLADVTQGNTTANMLNSSIEDFKARVTQAGDVGQTFIDQIGSRMKNLVVYLSSFVQFYDIIRYFQQGIQVVKEYDSAMVDLKKVAQGTTAQIEDFGKKSYEIADAIGSTNTAIIQAGTEWARLGKDMNSVESLARASTIYSNVGEVDATTATQDLISAMNAFSLADEDAMSVVDKMNIVGNNYAVSSAQLGEILEKSSASLAVSGDDIDHVIAMGAAMNETLQDSSTVGSTLKIVGLRLRGTKTEIEELGEETDGMAESTSKLRSDIMALTNVNGKGGFDIMKNNKEYKTTYDIIKGIADVWDDMSQIDQSALLEEIAGKNRAQGAAALIANFDTAEKALQDSLNAEGSAEKENSAYLESIEAHQAQLTNATNQFWNNLVNKDVVIFFTDLGTQLVKLTNKFGSLKTVIAGVVTAVTGIKPMLQGQGLFTTSYGQSGKAKGLRLNDANGAVAFINRLRSGTPSNPGTAFTDDDTARYWIQKRMDMQGVGSTEISALTHEINETATGANANGLTRDFATWYSNQIALGQTFEDQNATLERYHQHIQQVRQAENEASVATLAWKSAMGLVNTAISIGASVALTALASGIMEVISYTVTYDKTLRESAANTATAYKESCDSIDEYAEKVKSDYEIINDSSSSVEEVANARLDLMNVQNELINKFGEEEGAIDNITDALNNQTDAWQKLKNSSWEAQKSSFISENKPKGIVEGFGSFFKTVGSGIASAWTGGKSATYDAKKPLDNLESQMEHQRIRVSDVFSAVGDYYSLSSEVQSQTQNTIAALGMGGANGSTAYHNIYDMMDILKKQKEEAEKTITNPDELITFQNAMDSLISDYQTIINEQGDFYDQLVLNDKILNENNGIVDSYNELGKAYTSYTDAYSNGDETKTNSALEDFRKAFTVLQSSDLYKNDSGVKHYIDSLYTGVQLEADKHNFELNFNANTDGVKDKVNKALDTIRDENSFGVISKGTILDLEDSEGSIQELTEIANNYNLSLSELLSQFEDMALISSAAYQELVESGFDKNRLDRLSNDQISGIYGGTQSYKDFLNLPGDVVAGGNSKIFDYIYSDDYSDYQRDWIAQSDNIAEMYRTYQDISKAIEEAGKNSEILQYRLSQTSINVSDLTDDSTALSSALSETNSNGYISTDTLTTLNSEIEDTDGLLIATSEGVKLNADAMNEYISVQSKDKTDELTSILDGYVSQLNTTKDNLDKLKAASEKVADADGELTGDLGELSDGTQITADTIESLTSAQKENAEYAEKQISTISTQLGLVKQLTSAYNKYISATSTSNQGSRFDTIVSSYDATKKLYDNGQYYTDDVMEFVRLFGSSETNVNQDSTRAQMQAAWKTAAANYEKYMTDDAKGPTAMYDKLYNTLKKNNGTIDGASFSYDKDGNILGIDVDDIEKTADALKVTSDVLEIAMEKLQEYQGNDIWSYTGIGKDTDDIIADIKSASAAIDENTQKYKANNAAKEEAVEATESVEVTVSDETKEQLEAKKNDILSQIQSKLSADANANLELIITAVYENDDPSQEQLLGQAFELKKQIESALSIEDTSLADNLKAQLDTLFTENSDIFGDNTESVKEIILKADVSSYLEKSDTVKEEQDNIEQWFDKTFTLNVDTSSAITYLDNFLTAYKNTKEYIDTNPITLNTGNVKVGDTTSTTDEENVGDLPTFSKYGGIARADGTLNNLTPGTTLVGELGQELVVDRSTGQWRTVGDNGAEFTKIDKGDIVFNANQTKALLSSGHINGRGKALANGQNNDLVGELGPEIRVHNGKWDLVGQDGAEFTNIGSSDMVIPADETARLLSGKSYAEGKAYSGNDIYNSATARKIDPTGSPTTNEAAKAAEEAKKATEDNTKATKEQTKQEYNWIETLQNTVEHQRDIISETEATPEWNSYETRISGYRKMIELDKREVEAATIAVKNYASKLDEKFDAIRDAFGDDTATAEKYINLIKNGTLDKNWYTELVQAQDEANGESSDAAQALYNKQTKAISDAQQWWTEQQNAESDIIKWQKQEHEDLKAIYDLQLEQNKALISAIDSDISAMQTKISMKDVVGEIVTTGDYEDLIAATDDKIAAYYEQIEILQNEMAELGDDADSAEYDELEASIADCNAQILECEKSQAEWNEEIKQLPITHIESYIENLKTAQSDLNDYISELEATGQKVTADIIKQQMELEQLVAQQYKNELEKVEKNLNTYTPGKMYCP